MKINTKYLFYILSGSFILAALAVSVITHYYILDYFFLKKDTKNI